MSRRTATTAAASQSSSPELRLLLAAIKSAVDGRPQCDNPLIISRETRWIWFMTLALEHHAGGLAFAGLSRMPGLLIPPPVIAQLGKHARDILKQRAAGIEELRRIALALARAGIEMMPIKGPLLRQRLFAGVAAGPSRDLDLLIEPHNVSLAFDILAQCGYHGQTGFSSKQSRTLMRLYGQDLLERDDGQFAIEPHIAIVPSNLGVKIDHEAMWKRSRVIELDGAAIRVLEPEDEFVLLAVHGSKEGWARLKWLADLAALVVREPTIDWELVSKRAKQQLLERMVGLSALLLAKTFAVEIPPAARARRDKRLRVMARRIAYCWEHPLEIRLFKPSIFELSWTRSLLCDGAVARFSYFFRTLITPREMHYRMIKLPDWMCSTYYAIKVVHDYLLWPAWMLVKWVARGFTRTVHHAFGLRNGKTELNT
jgi:hypothetical protein